MMAGQHSCALLILLALALIGRNCTAFVALRTRAQMSALSPSPFAAIRNARSVRSLVLFYQNATSSIRTEQAQVAETLERFKREAAKKKEIDEECVLTIHGNQYNMTSWANAHPGKQKNYQLFRLCSDIFQCCHVVSHIFPVVVHIIVRF
jgi:hypothetical protein